MYNKVKTAQKELPLEIIPYSLRIREMFLKFIFWIFLREMILHVHW